MAEDRFVASVQKVSETARTVCESVEAAVRPLQRAREARLAGRPMSEIVDDLIRSGGRDVRLGAAEAFRQYDLFRSLLQSRLGVLPSDEMELLLRRCTSRDDAVTAAR